MTTDELVLDFKIKHFKEMLETQRRVAITVRGSSMWPFLKNNDVVIIQPCCLKDIKVGDIVFTYVDSRPLCHRVFRKGKDHIQTRPDALSSLDCRVCQDDIVGKVVARLRGAKTKRLDGPVRQRINFIISRTAVLRSFFYPVLRFVKRRICPRLIR